MSSDLRNLYLLLAKQPRLCQNPTLSKQPAKTDYWSILYYFLSPSLPLACCLFPTLVKAQPIIPAADGTGTLVIPQGNQFQITGGQLSGDRANLFHSLQKFGLSEGQIANFLANPNLQNILVRVTGGEASKINGLIQVSGGNPYLFLMNPAGIVFGKNAQLNVSGSFTATTATGIGFDSAWFNAVGVNDYQRLTGTPSQLAFPNSQVGSIINEGELRVGTGENLNLVGGTVINTGELKAEAGQINIIAVPGENLVRINQEGHLLSLEIRPWSGLEMSQQPELWQMPISALPELLTRGEINHATGVTVNEKGQVVLTGSGVSVAPDSGLVLVSGKVDAAAPSWSNQGIQTVSQDSLAKEAGGTIQITGDRIEVLRAEINASGQTWGGTVRMNTPDVSADFNSRTSLSGTVRISADSTILADAGQVGNGGEILVAGTGKIEVSGQLSARAGQLAGNGGGVELVGGGYFEGSVDLGARNGDRGTLKLNQHQWRGLPTDQPLKIAEGTLENLATHSNIIIGDSLSQASWGVNPPTQTEQLAIPQQFNSIHQIELFRNREFNPNLFADVNVKTIRERLSQVAQEIGKRPAVIYVISRLEQLELAVVTPFGEPIFRRIPAANFQAFRQQVRSLIRQVSTAPTPNNAEAYKEPAQQLYHWLIDPIEAELQAQKIDLLLFSLDPGMRSLPLAALQDGKQFLVQKYSIGLIPSISLTDTRYTNLNNSAILAMGASRFKDPLILPLPAVPSELASITHHWRGKTFIDRDFTLENLKPQNYSIIHLATHGKFNPEHPQDSYLQLWDSKLTLNQLRKLGDRQHPIELLVLSACETALGNFDHELGLAGLAVQSGVKSVLATLWQVNDVGTLALMDEFYHQLAHQAKTIKAEALRQAQIAMIEGKLLLESGQLRRSDRGDTSIILQHQSEEKKDLSHPYYWASFLMIGSPW